MSELSKEILTRLGLDPKSQTEEIVSCPRPDTGVARGRAGITSQPLADLLKEAIPQNPAFTAIEITALKERAPGCKLTRWDVNPSILSVQVEGAEAHSHGEVYHPEQGAYWLDSRQSPAFLRLSGSPSLGENVIVLSVTEGDVKVFQVEIGTSRRAQPQTASLAERPEIEPPDLEVIRMNFTLPQWLQKQTEALAASSSSLARVAAAGLIARLWTPAASDLEEAQKKVLAGKGPLAKAVEWFKNLPSEAQSGIEQMAIEEATRLGGAMASLQNSVIQEGEKARELAKAWIYQRDDLESISLLLHAAGKGEPLRETLKSLDAEVSDYHSIWSVLGGFEEDERLRAVSWQEPDAWWGGLALG